MTTKTVKPKGMPWVSPYLIVQDVDQSLSFYKEAFGFNRREAQEIVKNDEGESVHAELQYQDMVVMIGKEGAYDKTMLSPKSSNQEPPLSLYVYHEDVDALCAQAKRAGAQILMEPEMSFWGDKMCRIKDCNGYLWSFATFQGEK